MARYRYENQGLRSRSCAEVIVIMKRCLFALLLVTVSCAEQPQLYDIDLGDPNAEFIIEEPGILRPHELKFRKATVGQAVVLHSAIVTPPPGEHGRLVIGFRRSDLEEQFIRAFFFDADSRERKQHPFAAQGVEAVLTKDSLFLTVHAGANMHFRNDMESFPDYRTFISEDVVGRVIEVEGNIQYSDDTNLIRRKLKDIFTFTHYSDGYFANIEGVEYRQRQDGSVVLVVPPGTELPPKTYPPRVEVE